MESLGELISARRRRIKMSQKELADKVGVSMGYISEIELNKKHPSEELIEKLSVELAEPQILVHRHSRDTFTLRTQHVSLVDGKIEVRIGVAKVDVGILNGAEEFFRVDNESMLEAGIRPGTFVGYRRTQSFDNRDIMVLRIDGEMMVRGLTRIGHELLALPANRSWPVESSEEKTFEILGKAVVLVSVPLASFYESYTDAVTQGG